MVVVVVVDQLNNMVKLNVRITILLIESFLKVIFYNLETCELVERSRIPDDVSHHLSDKWKFILNKTHNWGVMLSIKLSSFIWSPCHMLHVRIQYSINPVILIIFVYSTVVIWCCNTSIYIYQNLYNLQEVQRCHNVISAKCTFLFKHSVKLISVLH